MTPKSKIPAGDFCESDSIFIPELWLRTFVQPKDHSISFGHLYELIEVQKTLLENRMGEPTLAVKDSVTQLLQIGG